jgi:hypothetical protein
MAEDPSQSLPARSRASDESVSSHPTRLGKIFELEKNLVQPLAGGSMTLDEPALSRPKMEKMVKVIELQEDLVHPLTSEDKTNTVVRKPLLCKRKSMGEVLELDGDLS